MRAGGGGPPGGRLRSSYPESPAVRDGMMPSGQHQRVALDRAVAVRPDVVRSHFGNVPETGLVLVHRRYQPAQKWLKDRKGGAVGAWVGEADRLGFVPLGQAATGRGVSI